MKKKFLLIIILLLFSSLVGAMVPDHISIPIYATNNEGEINGTFNFTFKIYDAPSGGTTLFTKTESLDINNGSTNIILDNTGLAYNISYWLGVTMGSGSEYTPRINITKSPYAHRSNISESLANEAFINESGDNATGTISISKNLTISENVTIYGNLSINNNISTSSISTNRQCLGVLCINSFDEVNKTYTESDLYLTLTAFDFGFDQAALNTTIHDKVAKDGFFNDETNLTGLLDDNYLGIGSDWVNISGDTMTSGLLATGLNSSGRSNASIFCLDNVCVDTWAEVNITDTFVTSTNVSAWGVYYYDIYNLTSLLNTTYLARTGGNMSGGLLGTSFNATGAINGSIFCLDAVCVDTYNEINATNNPFDQNLNTTDNVKFSNVNISNNLTFTDNFSLNIIDGTGTLKNRLFLSGTAIRSSGQIYAGTSLASGSGIYTSGFIYSAEDIYTTGSGDDLWLGASVQNNANFRAYATGALFITSVDLGGTSISSWNEINKTGTGIANGSNAFLAEVNITGNLNVSKNVTISENLTVYGEIIAEKNITLNDNFGTCYGDSGCSDSIIYFNGSSLIIQVN